MNIEPEGFTVGDRVEVLSDQGKRQPGMATIQEMQWNRYTQTIEYVLRGNELLFRRVYASDELRHALKLNESRARRGLQLRSAEQADA